MRHVRGILALASIGGLAGCGLWGAYAPIRYQSPAPASAEIRWIESSVSDLTADVEVRDARANADPAAIDRVTIKVYSGTDLAGKPLVIAETGPNAGVFRGSVSLVRPFDPQTGVPLAIGAEGLVIFAEGDPTGDPLEAAYAGPTGVVRAQAVYKEPSSTVIGRLEWPDGRVCPGAEVVLEGPDGFRRTTISRSDGNYAFYGVPSGTYQMTATKDGATVERTKLVNTP